MTEEKAVDWTYIGMLDATLTEEFGNREYMVVLDTATTEAVLLDQDMSECHRISDPAFIDACLACKASSVLRGA